MEAEVEARTGAAKGARSPGRHAHCPEYTDDRIGTVAVFQRQGGHNHGAGDGEPERAVHIGPAHEKGEAEAAVIV